MSGNSLSRPKRTVPAHQNLTPNERAIIDRIKVPLLRGLFTGIWRVKLRLQFTGWLQYIIPATFTLALSLIAGIARLFGSAAAAIPFVCVAALLFFVLSFDLVTVKVRLRPRERRPKRNDALGIFDLMRARRSCRSFQTRKLTSADRDELMSYVRLHTEEPKLGLFPVRFEYVSGALTVWPTVNATEFLVAIAPKEYDRLAVIDVGHSLQKIVMDATRMGLGTCWIGPGADHESIMHFLGSRFDPEEDHIICVCAVGYRSRFVPMFIRLFNARMHRRLPLSALFFADRQLKVPLDVDAYPFSRFERTYEICQWAPSSYNGQPTRCAAVLEKNRDGSEGQLARFDFYAFIESRYYAPVAVGIWCANWEMGCAALDIHGHFAVPPDEPKDIHHDNGHQQLPRYDISWVIDETR